MTELDASVLELLGSDTGLLIERVRQDAFRPGPSLQAGDVLLVQGQPEDVAHLRAFRDVVLLEWSTEELPALRHATRAGLIFLAVVGLAASGILPIVVSALCGAAAMVVVGVLNVRQVFQAVDAKIVTTIAAALALGVALQETGGAAYLARTLLVALQGQSVSVVLSLFFRASLMQAGLSSWQRNSVSRLLIG